MSGATVILDPGSSRALAAGLTAIHAAAVAAVLDSGLPDPARALTIAWIAASLFVGVRRVVVRRGPAAVRRLLWDADGSWWLWDGRGVEHAVAVHGEYLNTPWLVLLRLRRIESPRPRIWAAVLARDALPADAFRRLRVRLRVTDVGAAPDTANP